jgi:hypothetical protein
MKHKSEFWDVTEGNIVVAPWNQTWCLCKQNNRHTIKPFHTTHRGHCKELVSTYHYTFGFEVLTVMTMWSSIFWDVMLYSLMKVKQHSGGTYHSTYCLQHQPRKSCRDLFKRLQILPLPCKYIFSLINFIINNQEYFQTNADIHTQETSTIS